MQKTITSLRTVHDYMFENTYNNLSLIFKKNIDSNVSDRSTQIG